jgi:hypothetical protein
MFVVSARAIDGVARVSNWRVSQQVRLIAVAFVSDSSAVASCPPISSGQQQEVIAFAMGMHQM